MIYHGQCYAVCRCVCDHAVVLLVQFDKSVQVARANLSLLTCCVRANYITNRLSESDGLERVRASFKSCSIDGGGDDDDGKSPYLL
jgi:hypothetical protein